jgi:ArsR family transcriptional regulator, arsenate/arsenite/antimonite-responsive transcriptional repressor
MSSMKELAVIDPVGALAECCTPRRSRKPLPRHEAERLADAIGVLADPARLQLLSLIGSEADGEACVCDLTEPLGLTQPTVSHHLKVLHQAGLLEREQRGRWAFYRLAPERLAALQRALPRERVRA